MIKWSRLCNVLLLLTTQISVHAFHLHSAIRGSMWKTGGREESAKREERKEMNREKQQGQRKAGPLKFRFWMHIQMLMQTYNFGIRKDATNEQECNLIKILWCL